MSTTPRISPEEAKTLLDAGYTYVDVRSEPEFEQGHVPGALNVPLMHKGPSGLAANPDFQAVMEQAFAKDDRLLIGCQSGGRSLKAVGILERAGFTTMQELKTGFGGSRDAFGRAEPGWASKGFPVEAGATQGQSYADVKERRR